MLKRMGAAGVFNVRGDSRHAQEIGGTRKTAMQPSH